MHPTIYKRCCACMQFCIVAQSHRHTCAHHAAAGCSKACASRNTAAAAAWYELKTWLLLIPAPCLPPSSTHQPGVTPPPMLSSATWHYTTRATLAAPDNHSTCSCNSCTLPVRRLQGVFLQTHGGTGRPSPAANLPHSCITADPMQAWMLYTTGTKHVRLPCT